MPEEAHPYGKPNRPGTPVGDVISYYYGDVAEKQITAKYSILRETSKPLGLNFARSHTKASALAQSHVSQENYNKVYGSTQKDLFKMSKFKNVKPRTDTHNKGQKK